MIIVLAATISKRSSSMSITQLTTPTVRSGRIIQMTEFYVSVATIVMDFIVPSERPYIRPLPNEPIDRIQELPKRTFAVVS
jgi:hypothetical protein